MSHRLVRQLISDSTPPMNRLIVDGLATSHIPMSEDYIHGIMKNAVESFPQGIEYLDARGAIQAKSSEKLLDLEITKEQLILLGLIFT